MILFFEVDNWIDVEKKANLGLSVVSKWYTKNSLMLNKKKSVFNPFALASQNTPEHIIIKLHNNKCKKKNSLN